jgi:hypothetical protein
MASTAEATLDRDSFAQWYASRHLQTDTGVVEIHYLPTNSPPREIRFLEVNHLISETTPLEPIDFGVDIGGAEAHTLYVLDVTPVQWEAIRDGQLSLPAGWTLENERVLERR